MHLLAATWLTSTLVCSANLDGAEPDSLRALWEAGRPFADFITGARARRATWHANYEWGRLESDVASRLGNLKGSWRLLVIAEDACGDSANTIPYLATMVDSSGFRLEMRVIDSRLGRAVMEAHRTADGRPATPTVLLLGEGWEESGCWVERPANLAIWFEDAKRRLGDRAALEEKYAWYDRDRGASTQRDILAMIEQAGTDRACGGNTTAGTSAASTEKPPPAR